MRVVQATVIAQLFLAFIAPACDSNGTSLPAADTSSRTDVVAPLDAPGSDVPVVPGRDIRDAVDADEETAGDGCRNAPIPVISVEEGDEVIPQTTLHLKGDQSRAVGLGNFVRRFQWSVEQPVGSRSVFIPSPTFPNPTFEANVMGTYTFCLEVWDDRGVEGCEIACEDIVVTCASGIRVELLWRTPGDPDETDTGPFTGSSLDLHFLHPRARNDPNQPDLDGDGSPDPYFQEPFDCYWFNPHPDWGVPGEGLDDPGLDRNDVDGAGPENMNLTRPEYDTSYEIAVHYWNDNDFGPAFATVRVYVHENVVVEEADVALAELDMWSVGWVHWPEGTVTPCRRAGERCITPGYMPDAFEP